VLGGTPARAATSSVVVASKPWLAKSSVLALTSD
jgi:hypothetical protein